MVSWLSLDGAPLGEPRFGGVPALAGEHDVVRPLKLARAETPDIAEIAPPGMAETEPARVSEPGPAEASESEPAEASEAESVEPVEPSQAPSTEPPAAEPVEPSEAPSTEPPAAEPMQPSEVPSTEPSATEPVEPSEVPSTEPSATEPVEPSETQSAEPPELSDAELLEMLETELGDQPREGPVRLRFNFRYQPWEDVLDWFAGQADLSLVYETLPQGTCNYVDGREYTLGEALDVLNSLLLIKGYTLVRRERMLVVVNLEDGVPPILVTTVPVDELDERGEYELVSTVFRLEKVTAEEAQAEIEKLIGPQGSIVVLPKAQQIVVTETAGRLRTIRDALQRIEDPEGLSSLQLRSFPLEFALVEDVLAILRQLFGIPADQNAAPDGSIRFASDPLGMRLIVFGKPSKLDQVAKVLEAIDAPGMGDSETEGVPAALQVEVYNVAPADPESVLKVMQTLLQGTPGARLSTDPKTGNLIALARVEDHATIRATLEQLRNDAICVEVIPLRSLDPQVAVLSITKLFGGGEGSTLKVDADPTTRRLVIRGPRTVVQQIREWLEQMGEAGTADASVATGGNVRMLPLSGGGADSALQLLQQIWPSLHRNKIRVVTPSAVIPTLRTGGSEEETLKADEALLRGSLAPRPPSGTPPVRQPGSQPLNPRQPPGGPPALQAQPPQPTEPPFELAPPSSESPPADAAQPEAKSAARDAALRPRVIFASETVQAEAESEGLESPQTEPPPIMVAVGPGGIMIASEDTEALDDLEQLLTTLASGAMLGTTDLTIFYLVHAEATVVAETLSQVLGGGTAAGGGASNEGFSPEELAGAAFGGPEALAGSLLALGGGATIAPSGPVRIIPDTRLNALVVRANPTDTDTIKQLLEILDQKGTPGEILVQPKPRLIPVHNTRADEVAEIVRQVYQDRMVTASGAARPPTPQEFFAAMRGGRGRSRDSGRSATDDAQKMSIGVDARTNSLVVSAPEALFQEVKQLVEQLDEAAIGSTNQAVQVVTLKGANPQAVQQALSTLLGEGLTSSRTGSRSRRSSSAGQTSQTGPTPPFSPPSMDDMRRRIEFFRAMRGGGGFRGPSGGGRPSGGQGPGPGGGFPRPAR